MKLQEDATESTHQPEDETNTDCDTEENEEEVEWTEDDYPEVSNTDP